jgi:hypothetical protein
MFQSVVTRRVALCLCLAASGPALAQDDCAPTINALATLVLDGREELPPLQARRFGTRALYLLLRYDGIAEEEADALLSDAVGDRVHGATDLQSAWQASLGEPLPANPDSSQPSALRAMLLGSDADAAMTALAGMPEGERFDLGQLMIAVTFDQPDEVKANLGAAAAVAELDWLALGFAAAQSDHEAWEDAIAALSPAEREMVAPTWRWMPAYSGNRVISLGTQPQDAEAEARMEAVRLVAWASSLQPEAELLSTYLNQTGESAVAAAVAKSLIKQFENGTIGSRGPLDAGWLAAARAFVAVGAGPEALADGLGNTAANVNREGRETIVDVLDWIIAVDALKPYVSGEGPMPVEPDGLSSSFSNWGHWKSLAQGLRDTSDDALVADAEDLPIIAELLHAAGRRDALVRLLREAPSGLATVAMANDFAGRIDRACEAHLWQRGEAVLLAGRALYAFEP